MVSSSSSAKFLGGALLALGFLGAGLFVVGGSQISKSQFSPCIKRPPTGLGVLEAGLGLGFFVVGTSSNTPCKKLSYLLPLNWFSNMLTASLTRCPKALGVVGPIPCSFNMAAKIASSVFP